MLNATETAGTNMPPPKPEPDPGSVRGSQLPAHENMISDPSTTYIADGFTLSVGDLWCNDTAYRLEGPVQDNFQHVIRISVNPEVGEMSVVDYAERRVAQQTASLDPGDLLARSRTKLDNGRPASRCIFSLTSGDDRLLYQEDWYVVHHGVGYRLSAQFTEHSLPVVGPTVEHIFRSFAPHLPLRRR